MAWRHGAKSQTIKPTNLPTAQSQFLHLLLYLFATESYIDLN